MSKSATSLQTEFGVLTVDLIEDRQNYLRPLPKKTGDLLAKALGYQKGYRRVLDATAGLLQDSVTMARLGFQVTALERVIPLARLLKQAHGQALQLKSQDPDYLWLNNIEIIEGDAQTFLNSLSPENYPEVIYLDPMFQQKKQKSLPRKEMQIFRQWVGEDTDFPELLEVARKSAQFRVVVKTPKQGDPRLPKAHHIFEGTTVAYHIYGQALSRKPSETR